jgi:hypothetical protein
MSGDDDQLVCATYTHARRHPMVLGKIGNWTPPFQLTLVQTAVLIVVFVVEAKTWKAWAGVLPPMLAVLLALGVPCLLAWAVRSTRIEGRSLPRLAVALVQYLAAPRRGVVGGRPHRDGRRVAPEFTMIVASGRDLR